MVMSQQSLSKARGSSEVQLRDCHRWLKNCPHTVPGGTNSPELPWAPEKWEYCWVINRSSSHSTWRIWGRSLRLQQFSGSKNGPKEEISQSLAGGLSKLEEWQFPARGHSLSSPGHLGLLAHHSPDSRRLSPMHLPVCSHSMPHRCISSWHTHGHRVWHWCSWGWL